jgi:hypothetical protein
MTQNIPPEQRHVTLDPDQLERTIDRIERQSSDPESVGQLGGIAKMLLAELVERQRVAMEVGQSLKDMGDGMDTINAGLFAFQERAEQAEAEAAAYRMLHVDLWKLIGRCDMAFELISEAKLLGPAKQTARQLRAEIKKASNT